MREWSLARIVWVADRGFASAENRRLLQQGAGGYILGEKLRARGTAALVMANVDKPVVDLVLLPAHAGGVS